ncbi:MAG: carboxypeptidase-like regulatory domain-containing protein, partial [Bacteroidales bacterium]
NLNKAFLYNGDNLCIAAENIGNSTLSSNQNLFYVSTISDTNRAYYIYGDSTKEKVYTPLLADAIFSLQTKNGGVLSGKTTYKQENLSNVRVFVNDHKVEKQTDSNGNYAFLYLPQGNHKITYSKFGYVDTSTTVYITKGSTLIRNINMEKRKQYKLTGKVTDLNAKPIAGATIYLSGYDTAISISDANGVFTFPAIFGSATYTIEINHPLYKNLSSSFHLEESPLELGSLKMEERPFPPYKVIAQKDKEKDFVKISCENLHTPYHKNQILDDSTFENGTCHNPNVNIMLGNKFANTDSGIITHVSIYGFRKADAIAGVSVGLYIFDQHRNPILYNVPVEIPADTWVDVPINNLCFSGDFYVMLCWKNADGSTNYLARDQNGPFSHASLDYEYKVKTGEWLENSGGNIEAGVYAIRAATILNGTTVGNAKTLNKQNVYRLLSDKENADTSWTLLGELSSSYPYYTDSNFSLLPQGIYQYAVKNIYTGINNISTPSFSNSIYLDMFTQATITVKSKPS